MDSRPIEERALPWVLEREVPDPGRRFVGTTTEREGATFLT